MIVFSPIFIFHWEKDDRETYHKRYYGEDNAFEPWKSENYAQRETYHKKAFAKSW